MDDRERRYVLDQFAHEDPIQRVTREGHETAGLPAITISPEAGRFLEVLFRAARVRHALEIGTLGGYSALWMLRALPEDGTLVTIECDSAHVGYARRAFGAAGHADRVTIMEGDARMILPTLDGPFDAIFVDANKDAMPFYFGEAVRLLHVGGLLLGDNAFWGGKVLDETVADEETAGVRRFNAFAAADPRLVATILPVGDGLLFGVKVRA